MPMEQFDSWCHIITASLAFLGFLGLTESASGEGAKASKVRPGKDWEEAVAAFEARDKDKPPPKGAIVFTGASNFTRWKTMQADFPGHKIINRGFGGSRMSDAVRFADRVVVPYAPRLVVLQAGGNDIFAGRPVEEVVADFKAWAEKVRAALPDVRLCYLGIPSSPSRWPIREKCQKANTLIKEYIATQSHMRFIDCWDSMLNEAGQPREECFVADRLHNSEEGYKMYVKLIQPFLDEK